MQHSYRFVFFITAVGIGVSGGPKEVFFSVTHVLYYIENIILNLYLQQKLPPLYPGNEGGDGKLMVAWDVSAICPPKP